MRDTHYPNAEEGVRRMNEKLWKSKLNKLKK